MKKILFGITSLTLGGAERVLVDLANGLSKDYEIVIWTLYGNGQLEKQLNKNIKIKTYMDKSYEQISKFQKLLMPLKVLFLKKHIYNTSIKGDYQVEVAFLEGPITRLMSVNNKNAKKIAWVHNDISKVFGNGLKAKMKKMIDEKIYSKFEKLVFVSKDNLKEFEKTYPNIKNEKQVIYNYLDSKAIIEKAKQDIEDFDKNTTNFVTVARLVEQKAIDRLINVHSNLIYNGLIHNFYIIGDGPQRAELEKLIKENNVEKTFHLCGRKENPYPYIKQADYFCLFSHYEGYGMVLDEAKILNKKILITDTAAREAVNNYNRAKIVDNNENAIYEILENILKNKEDKFDDSIEVKYENIQIIEQIKQLIEG